MRIQKIVALVMLAVLLIDTATDNNIKNTAGYPHQQLDHCLANESLADKESSTQEKPVNPPP